MTNVLDAYSFPARQIANACNLMAREGFDPQQALQEAVEWTEANFGWDVDFAARVYSYTWEAWDAGLLAWTTVREAIIRADS